MRFLGNTFQRINFTRVTEVDVAVYVLQPDDCTLHVLYPSTAACGITLPELQANDNRCIWIHDASGNAGTNNITITPAGGKTINGGVSLTISSNNGFTRIYAYGGNWFAGV